MRARTYVIHTDTHRHTHSYTFQLLGPRDTPPTHPQRERERMRERVTETVTEPETFLRNRTLHMGVDTTRPRACGENSPSSDRRMSDTAGSW